MCSFATIYGLVKLSGGKFKMGLTYNQYIKLSEIFPYFEDELKGNIIEGDLLRGTEKCSNAVQSAIQSLTKAIIFELFYYINDYFRV